jgi:MFS family permease
MPRVRWSRPALQSPTARLFVAMLLNEGAIGLYLTLWPLYIAALGASPPQIGLVLGYAGLIRLLCLLPSGVLNDRVSPRRLILITRTLAVLGLALCGLAREWWQLLPATTVLGVGVLAFPALSNLIASLSADSAQRTRNFTLLYTVAPSIAYLITPVLGGLIAEQVSLRATLLAASLLTAIAAAILVTIRPPATERVEGPPASYLAALRHRPVLLVSLMMLSTITFLTLGWALTPNFLQEVHGLEFQTIGWLGSMGAGGSVLLSLIISRVRLFQPPFNGLALALGAVIGGFAVLLLGSALWAFAIAYVLRGGFLVAWSVFYAAYGEVTPAELRSRAFALAEILGSAGSTIAPFLAGWLYEIDPRLPLALGLLVAFPLLATALQLGRQFRSPAPAAVPATTD